MLSQQVQVRKASGATYGRSGHVDFVSSRNQRDRNGMFRRYATRCVALWYVGLPVSRSPRASEIEAPTYHINVVVRPNTFETDELLNVTLIRGGLREALRLNNKTGGAKWSDFVKSKFKLYSDGPRKPEETALARACDNSGIRIKTPFAC
jgi:hypothetical protein